jgi:hypothetical protein
MNWNAYGRKSWPYWDTIAALAWKDWGKPRSILIRIAPSFWTSALDGNKWSASSPGRFTLRERATDTHCVSGWVAPRRGLYAVEKRKLSCPCQESNPVSTPTELSQELYLHATYAFMAWCLSNETQGHLLLVPQSNKSQKSEAVQLELTRSVIVAVDPPVLRL